MLTSSHRWDLKQHLARLGELLLLPAAKDGTCGYDLGVAAFESFAGEPDLWYQASFCYRCVQAWPGYMHPILAAIRCAGLALA
jgi:hypothetical protein